MKFRFKHLAVLLIIAICLSACTKIDYIGEEYPPTTHVDLFFDMDDVTREHKVMGNLIATADDGVSTEKMQKKIMEKARQKGADAVVIMGFDKYQSGETTSYRETTEEGETKKGKSKTTTTATSSTSVKEKKQIKAVFIKYL
ncbi:MAG: hypothetical protein IIA17_09370 [candidate division Zixibacteria bacterium]|nr:hypothetical protein [candidate division Zixibacteria bacterium]